MLAAYLKLPSRRALRVVRRVCRITVAFDGMNRWVRRGSLFGISVGSPFRVRSVGIFDSFNVLSPRPIVRL